MGSRCRIRIGTSGWVYGPWHGAFYPRDLRRGAELEFLASKLGSAELNASFYSLQRPEHYRSWAAQTPDDFLFAVKGSRFITHMKKLRDAEVPLANFFASGVLALGPKLGPLLWQLPPSLGFDSARLAAFFDLLPRSTGEAAALASRHDERLAGRALTETDADRPMRHALEVRHPSFACAEAVRLLREHDIGLVVADAAGDWPYLEDVTSDFVYVRLHGAEELYASGYTAEALDHWARLVRAWRAGESPRTEHTAAPPARRVRGRDVYVYFDNDIKAHAPHDAMALAERCR
ncbi:DUF72 domain-containing protein [Saccharopolyspora rosea]|uniref:DUF72 domain-containing protein n=1 Tax=Saccharopolyspora rosea TaxID=524884 RepID=A0ABW3FVH3_9PSEU|nr:DUF72 domain-containing protein [Saccharopolyspora rosea]